MMYSVAAITLAASATASNTLAPNMERYSQLMANKARTWEPMHPKSNPFATFNDDELMGLMGLSTRDLVGSKEQGAVSEKFFNAPGYPPPKYVHFPSQGPYCAQLPASWTNRTGWTTPRAAFERAQCGSDCATAGYGPCPSAEAQWRPGTCASTGKDFESQWSGDNPDPAIQCTEWCHAPGSTVVAVPEAYFAVPQLPTDFDARDKFSSCIGAIRNQLKCGSCWAFGGAETLSDNLCIQGKHSGPLSAQDLVSCDGTDHGCNGGDLIDAWDRLSNIGIVDQACMPYTAGNGTVKKCPGVCTGSGEFQRHKCGQAANMLEDVTAIKNGVYQMGAAETGFYVYEDFMDYKSGVYHHDNTTSNLPLGGHAVKIVGWGVAGAVNYWLVANSWGPTWGMDGFFKIDMADKDSAFALGGAFNCGSLAPPPAAPTPGPKCEDILPSNECTDTVKDCTTRHLVCAKTCKCCGYFQPPAYCKA